MAQEHSMDVVSEFDLQELRNALDQAQREATNRYDLKDSNVEIELKEDKIIINVASEMQLQAVDGIILQKIINRGVSPKILKKKPHEQAGGMRIKQEIELIKCLDQENAKLISKIVRDKLPKVKANIQGSTVRLVSKSIDELQEARQVLLEDKSIEVPLQFNNFR